MYYSNDLSLVAALVTLGFKPIDHKINDSGNVEFTFETSPQILEASKRHFADTLYLPTKSYHANIRSIKTQINHVRNNLKPTRN